MSIRNRLEEARILSGAGRQEGAFISVLIAAASTSRKRYAREIWDDGEAFKNFIYDEMGISRAPSSIILSALKYNFAPPFQGKNTPLEDILYHHLRCQLVHEGEMPETIKFTQPVFQDGKTFNVMHLGDPMGFPAGWIEGLATAIWMAPENNDLWQDETELRQKAIEGLGDLWSVHLYCRRPGGKTKAMKQKKEKLEWTSDGIAFSVSYPLGVIHSQVADALEEKSADLR